MTHGYEIKRELLEGMGVLGEGGQRKKVDNCKSIINKYILNQSILIVRWICVVRSSLHKVTNLHTAAGTRQPHSGSGPCPFTKLFT